MELVQIFFITMALQIWLQIKFILCGSGSSSFSECGSGSRFRSSLTKFEEKKSWRVFLFCKKHKRLLQSKKQWSWCKFTFKKLNKVEVINNFLAFFQLLVDKFTLPDPDPGGEMNADTCGSGSTALNKIIWKPTSPNWKWKIKFN